MGLAMAMDCGGEREGEVSCERQRVVLYRYSCLSIFSIICGHGRFDGGGFFGAVILVHLRRECSLFSAIYTVMNRKWSFVMRSSWNQISNRGATALMRASTSPPFPGGCNPHRP